MSPESFGHVVAGDALGFVREAVAPHVGGDGAEAGGGELGDQVAPGQPHLGPAVEQEGEGPLPLLDAVEPEGARPVAEADVTVGEPVLLPGVFHRGPESNAPGSSVHRGGPAASQQSSRVAPKTK